MNKFTIYIVTNDVNDKVYIGQTTKSIHERFNEHCSYSFSKIGNAIQSIGKEHFTVSLLDDTAANLDELAEKEEFYIQKYNSIENGYNSRPACKSKGRISCLKERYTTTIDSELLEKIKIQAIKEKRSVSDLLEELIKKYFEEIATE